MVAIAYFSYFLLGFVCHALIWMEISLFFKYRRIEKHLERQRKILKEEQAEADVKISILERNAQEPTDEKVDDLLRIIIPLLRHEGELFGAHSMAEHIFNPRSSNKEEEEKKHDKKKNRKS